MNDNDFSPRLQKGIWSENGNIYTESFKSEGKGTDLDIHILPEYHEITCLADYLALLKEIHDEKEVRLAEKEDACGSLFLYRGQRDINWAEYPPMMRHKENLKHEHLVLKEFHRQFYEKFDTCQTMLEEEILLQHYGSFGRCMDLLEHPLIALWAACDKEEDKEKGDEPGAVTIWCLDREADELKAYDSSTVSLIANTAKMEYEFFLGDLDMAYHREHPTAMADFIYIKDVLRRSVVVRPKFNNQRINNQQTCFAISNLNKLIDINGDFQARFGVSVETFTDYILNAEILNADKSVEFREPNLIRLREGKHTLHGADFSNLTAWDLWFQKMTPKEAPFVDALDLYRHMYSRSAGENERIPVYAVVPTEYKDSIRKELAYMNITEAFIYPEMANVAKQMREIFKIRK